MKRPKKSTKKPRTAHHQRSLEQALAEIGSSDFPDPPDTDIDSTLKSGWPTCPPPDLQH